MYNARTTFHFWTTTRVRDALVVESQDTPWYLDNLLPGTNNRSMTVGVTPIAGVWLIVGVTTDSICGVNLQLMWNRILAPADLKLQRRRLRKIWLLCSWKIFHRKSMMSWYKTKWSPIIMAKRANHHFLSFPKSRFYFLIAFVFKSRTVTKRRRN